MPARPLYLGTDVLQRARDLEFRQRADRDIWKLGFDQQAESDISGLSKLIEPPKLELQAAPEQEPLPIVVSDRPDAMALQQQAQERQTAQQPTMQPQQQAPAAMSGTPVAMQAPVGAVRQPTGDASAFGVLDESSPEAFRQSLADSAQVVGQKYDLPWQVIAAIPIQETGFRVSRLGREGNNLFSIKGEGPAGSMQFSEGAAPEDLNTPFRKYNNAAESFDDFGRLITTQPRYAEAVRVWRETRDPARFIEEVQKAGYATDWGDADGTGVPWWRKVMNIAADIPQPRAQAMRATPTAAEQTPAAQQQYDPANLVPNQITESTSAGLDWDTALATCGVAAAVAFARANGRTPTWQEAMQLAEASGWNKDVGMSRGTAGQIELLSRLGVKARAGRLDEPTIAATVQTGQPVIVNAHGNGGHFYVATQYDPSTRKFNFGNSAAVLKRSGGQTWFRLDELPALGVGTPSEAIYMGAN